MDRKTVTCPESWKNMREELVSVGSHSSLSLPVFSYISPNVRRKFTTCAPRLSRVSGIRVRVRRSAKEREDADGEHRCWLTYNARRVISRSKERACRKRRGGPREGGESDPEGRPDSEQSSLDRLNTEAKDQELRTLTV